MAEMSRTWQEKLQESERRRMEEIAEMEVSVEQGNLKGESAVAAILPPCIMEGELLYGLRQAPDSETSLTPVFLSSTCLRQSGAAQ